jgi:hypothetical protein
MGGRAGSRTTDRNEARRHSSGNIVSISREPDSLIPLMNPLRGVTGQSRCIARGFADVLAEGAERVPALAGENGLASLNSGRTNDGA